MVSEVENDAVQPKHTLLEGFDGISIIPSLLVPFDNQQRDATDDPGLDDDVEKHDDHAYRLLDSVDWREVSIPNSRKRCHTPVQAHGVSFNRR